MPVLSRLRYTTGSLAVFCQKVGSSKGPKMQWLQDLGLTKVEVAEVISSWPNILGCSLERNFKPKVCLLLELV